MLPKPSVKYLNYGPLELARLTHKFEVVDDIEFLAVQDQVERLTRTEQKMYREHYIAIIRRLDLHQPST